MGAGVSGGFMAEALSKSHRVVVIDRRGVAKGSTAASTALIASEIDVPLTRLSRKVGSDAALRAWQRAALAVEAIRAFSMDLGLGGRGSQLVVRNSLYLAGDVLNTDDLVKEGEARRAAGIPAEYLSRARLREEFGVRSEAALLSFGQLAVNPVRLTAGYLKAAIGRGARVFVPVEAVGMETSRSGVTITTPHAAINAEHVIFCTGYEVPNFLSVAKANIASTYAFATPRQTRRLWPTRCLMWEASDPYMYVRDTPDGRVLCGGEDEKLDDAVERDALIPAKIEALRRKISCVLPNIDTTPEFRWAGSFAETETGLPLIGKIPGHESCWAVLGFGGNGTTFSRIAADIIRSALSGGQDLIAELFAFENRRRINNVTSTLADI